MCRDTRSKFFGSLCAQHFLSTCVFANFEKDLISPKLSCAPHELVVKLSIQELSSRVDELNREICQEPKTSSWIDLWFFAPIFVDSRHKFVRISRSKPWLDPFFTARAVACSKTANPWTGAKRRLFFWAGNHPRFSQTLCTFLGWKFLSFPFKTETCLWFGGVVVQKFRCWDTPSKGVQLHV